MLSVRPFTFNPFSENTYILYDETKECVIVDPGCYELSEKQELAGFIEENGLTPVAIFLTHAHIDHILGNNFIVGKYNIPIYMSKIETDLLKSAFVYGEMWGIKVEPSPDPTYFIEEGKELKFGNTTLEVFFTPGHSPGSYSFLHRPTNQLFSGDVLFNGSIGRTDLPGGNFDILEKSILEKLYVLSDEIIVFSGHGPETTIGHEKKTNPFVSLVSR